jgi:hypothetical protein
MGQLTAAQALAVVGRGGRQWQRREEMTAMVTYNGEGCQGRTEMVVGARPFISELGLTYQHLGHNEVSWRRRDKH